MASWREIDRIRKDPEGFRALATRLLKLPNEGFTEWETMFLESISLNRELKEFTTRQGEKLLQIRDDTELVTTCRDFSVKTLLHGCYEARLDLSEADEEWIVEIHERNSVSIKRRYIGRLMRCARQLGLIEQEEAA